MKGNIVLLNSDTQYCIFNIESFSLFNISEFTYNVLNHYLNEKLDEKDMYGQYDITQKEIDGLLLQIGYNKDYTPTATYKKCDTKRKVQRITLHISNDCNLRCKYCYAEGGAYRRSRSIMTLETAIQFVEYCCANFERVENIVFFGGEPFLNTPIMETVCKMFHNKYQNGEITSLPRFGAITNGTILNEKIFNLITKYFSFLTISVDGPKDIHDTNRIGKNNKGSFDAVNKFLKKIKEIPGLDIGIESTFTKQHIEAGYTHEEIREFFKSNYELNADVVDEIAIDKENMLSITNDISIESPWFLSILSTLVSKQAETKCDIVKSNFAISSDGDIFPCHMNVGDGMLPLSSIWGNGQEIVNLLNENDTYNLKANPICKSCWAANFCGGCSRSWFYNENEQQYSCNPNAERCIMFKKIATFALLKICKIRQNGNQWQKLLNKFGISPSNSI